jgi:hypothetical protein
MNQGAAPNFYSSVVFNLGFTFESLKELGARHGDWLLHRSLVACMWGILSTYRTSPWQQTVQNGHPPYKGTNTLCNWHSLWPLTRRRVRPWKPLAFTCLNLFSPMANCMQFCHELCVWMTSLFYAQMAGRRLMLFIWNCCDDLSSLSIACFYFLMGRNSHIQIKGWNSLHWMQKWLQ